MNRVASRRWGYIAAALFACIGPRAACAQSLDPDDILAELEGPKKPATVNVDFDDGRGDFRLTAFRQDVKPKATVVSRDGEQVFHLNTESAAWVSAWLRDATFQDFTLTVQLKKPNARQGYVGVCFRDGLKLFFRQQGRLQLTTDRPQNESRGESVAMYDIESMRELKLVCVGPIVRAYVDGEIALEAVSPEFDRAGPIALTTHSTSGYFDNLSITPEVASRDAMAITPVGRDGALRFDPDKPIKLAFMVANHASTAQPAAVSASIMTWDDKPVRTHDAKTLTVAPTSTSTIDMTLESVSTGYYKLVVETACDGDELPVRTYPFAVHAQPDVTYEPPTIPLAPYWKFKVANMAPLEKATYMHAAANSLRTHGFNAIVADVGIDDMQVDILKAYGIAVITRGTKCIDAPSVIAGLISDEPKADDIDDLVAEYAQLAKQTDKPLTTCMIGEGILTATKYWDMLKPKVRMFRWYGLKKNHYNVENRLTYKDVLSFVDTLVVADTASDSPWWIVLPSFGGTNIGAYYCNPLPSEMTAMMHLSLAYGADGLLFFCLQPYDDRNLALIDGVSLQPQDGKYEAIAKVNALIGKHADLISTLKVRGFDARGDHPSVEVVGLDSKQPDGQEKASDGRVNHQYVYAVNKSNSKTITCRIFNLDPGAKVTSVFTGETLACTKESVELRPGTSYETGVMTLTLAPGEGQLLRHRQDYAEPDAIAYPTWVADVPANKTVWLINETPTNTPMPGWLPKQEGSWKKKTWAMMNGKATLYSDLYNPLGNVCEKSLYAQAETTIAYALPEGAKTFVAAAGLGARSDASSVVFKVIVDGKEAFNSDVYRCGDKVIPVVVNVTGAKQIKLVTSDGGDGIGDDYAWWGDARIILH